MGIIHNRNTLKPKEFTAKTDYSSDCFVFSTVSSFRMTKAIRRIKTNVCGSDCINIKLLTL